MDALIYSIYIRYKIKIPRQLCFIIFYASKSGYIDDNMKFNDYTYDMLKNNSVVSAILGNNISVLKYLISNNGNIIDGLLCALYENNLKAIKCFLSYKIHLPSYSNIFEIIFKKCSNKYIIKLIQIFKLDRDDKNDLFFKSIKADNVEVYMFLKNKFNMEDEYSYALNNNSYNILKTIIKNNNGELEHTNYREVKINNKGILKILLSNKYEDKYEHEYIKPLLMKNWYKIINYLIINNKIPISKFLLYAVMYNRMKIFNYLQNKYNYIFVLNINDIFYMRNTEIIIIIKNCIKNNLIKDAENIFSNKEIKIAINSGCGDETIIDYIFNNKLLCSYKYVKFKKNVKEIYNECSYVIKKDSLYKNILKYHKYSEDRLLSSKTIEYIILKDEENIFKKAINMGIVLEKSYATYNYNIFKILYCLDKVNVYESLKLSIKYNSIDLINLILVLDTFDYTDLIIYAIKKYKGRIAKGISRNFKYNEKQVKLFIYEKKINDTSVILDFL